MTYVEESVAGIRKYLNKLSYFINNNSTFTFLDLKIIDKAKLDDILCCLEASFPNEYKAYLKRDDITIKEKGLVSISLYKSLSTGLHRKFWFSSDLYMINYVQSLNLISSFVTAFEYDMKILCKDL